MGYDSLDWVGPIALFEVRFLTKLSAAFQKCSQQATLLPSWTSVWQSASRAITSVSSSRAACHLMDVLLKLEVVPFSGVSDTIQAMLLSIELSGPGLFTESSASLMTTLIRMTIIENPTHYNQTAEKVLNWVLSKWTPSECLTSVEILHHSAN